MEGLKERERRVQPLAHNRGTTVQRMRHVCLLLLKSLRTLSLLLLRVVLLPTHSLLLRLKESPNCWNSRLPFRSLQFKFALLLPTLDQSLDFYLFAPSTRLNYQTFRDKSLTWLLILIVYFSRGQSQARNNTRLCMSISNVEEARAGAVRRLLKFRIISRNEQLFFN